ncbi:MAG TPA: transglycosylase family protein [Candidatus Saccharimonadales bacterium]|nr:transglycosylase family protein [Candidatus Saccharimonadales bacterium]
MRHKLTAVLAILAIAGFAVVLWPNSHESRPAPAEGMSRVSSSITPPEAEVQWNAFSVGRRGKTMPVVALPVPPPAPSPRLHTVANNESLAQIASQYGVADWRRLFDANPAMEHQDVTIEGQQLRIPEDQEQLVRRDLVLPPPPPPPTARAQTSQPPRQAKAQSQSRPAPVQPSGGDSSLGGLRNCESGGDYGAVSRSGKYRGAYQFDQQTWESVGGSGDPAAASPAEQDARARDLMARRGNSPWPTCG